MQQLIPDHTIPTVIRLTEELQQFIKSGHFPAGSPLPSTRALAHQFKVSTRTINLVLRELEAKKLVVCEPRKRTRVTSNTRAGTRVLAVISSEDQTRQQIESRPRWYTEILAHADQRLLEAGYHPTRVLIRPGEVGDEGNAERLLAEAGDPVVGALIRGGIDMVPLIRRFEAANIPWVTINRLTADTQCNFVSANMFESGRVLGGLLARSDRQRITIVCTKSQYVDGNGNIDFSTGLQVGYVQHGGDLEHVSFIQVADASEQASFDMMMSRYQEGRIASDAIVCAGDYNAIGILKACRKLGIRIHDDIAIVGCTGLELSAFVEPSLTVIEQPQREMGLAAADMLIHVIGAESHQVIGRVIRPRIVLRETFQVAPAVLGEFRSATPQTDIQIVTDDASLS